MYDLAVASQAAMLQQIHHLESECHRLQQQQHYLRGLIERAVKQLNLGGAYAIVMMHEMEHRDEEVKECNVCRTARQSIEAVKQLRAVIEQLR